MVLVVDAETKEYSMAVLVKGIDWVTLIVLLMVVVEEADTVKKVKKVKNGVVRGGTTTTCVKLKVSKVLVTTAWEQMGTAEKNKIDPKANKNKATSLGIFILYNDSITFEYTGFTNCQDGDNIEVVKLRKSETSRGNY